MSIATRVSSFFSAPVNLDGVQYFPGFDRGRFPFRRPDGTLGGIEGQVPEKVVYNDRNQVYRDNGTFIGVRPEECDFMRRTYVPSGHFNHGC